MKLIDTVISKNDSRYRAFPDIVRIGDRLAVVFRDSDCHVATQSRLMIAYSDDFGASWSDAVVLDHSCGHMPRASRLADGSVVIIDDGAPPNSKQAKCGVATRIFKLEPGQREFTSWQVPTGSPRCIPDCPTFAPDRILQINDNEWITLGQIRLGIISKRHSFANFVYRSLDAGRSWSIDTIALCDPKVRLCEPSMCRLKDGRIIAFYRNNEPNGATMYNFADSSGSTWDEARLAPFFGMRPTVGQLEDGRLFITYRKLDNPCGTAAWLGSLDELMSMDKSREFMLMPAGDNIPLGDFGYSGWIELSRGVVYVTYHHADESGQSYIRGVKITL